MKSLLERLNYRGQERIAIINDGDLISSGFFKERKDIRIDHEIDQRYPYKFMIIFVTKIPEVKKIAPAALHNLAVDGTLWFCYPKKSHKTHKSENNRHHGWEIMNDLGFYGVRMISVNDKWSALKFRSIKYLRSTNGRSQAKKILRRS